MKAEFFRQRGPRIARHGCVVGKPPVGARKELDPRAASARDNGSIHYTDQKRIRASSREALANP